MKSARSFVLAIAFFSAPLHAGQIYGTFRGVESPSGHRVEVQIGTRTYAAQLGAEGRYQIFVGETGAGQLRLHIGNARVAVRIFSYQGPTKYDFDLYRTAGGGYALKRR